MPFDGKIDGIIVSKKFLTFYHVYYAGADVSIVSRDDFNPSITSNNKTSIFKWHFGFNEFNSKFYWPYKSDQYRAKLTQVAEEFQILTCQNELYFNILLWIVRINLHPQKY